MTDARIPAWLWLVAALTSCGPSTPSDSGRAEGGGAAAPAAAPATAPATAPAAQAAATAAPSAVRPAAGPVDDRFAAGFPHTPHRNVACRTCHGRIRGHATHTGVACSACHAAAPTTATARTLTREECLGCHHGARQTFGCSTCHAPVPARSVDRSIQLSVWRTPRATSLPFDHERHGSLACDACHRDPPLLTPGRACGSCHRSHHRPDAACTACHAPPPGGAHDLRVHDGCSGAGCHAEAAVSTLPRSRATCLVCHRDRADHQPGQDCAPCHRLTSGKDES